MKTYHGASNDLHAAALPIKTRFVRTGEVRALKPGEWYVSGARPCAYLAKNGTIAAYAVCVPVKGQT